MNLKSKTSDPEDQLREDIASFYADPLGYVMYAFPWGVKGTRLAHETGPEDWQREELIALGEAVLRSEQGIAKGDDISSIRRAISSGHGIGKTGFVAWVIKWFMSTRMDPQCIVTANTETQLTKKTWRELAKWNRMSLDGHWFDWTATLFKYRSRPETWFAVAQTWSENNPDAFQGTHEDNVLLIFDEASGIPDQIWDSAEGAMTTARCIWLVFGNMTKATGRFVDCFGRFRHRWAHRRVDSRTVKRSNKAQIQEWLEDYGEDSDFFKIRVRGEKPRATATQFFPNDIIDQAMARNLEKSIWIHSPRLGGLDVARHGDDRSAHTERRGLKQFEPKIWFGKDTMWLAGWVAAELREAIDLADPYDAYFIDVTGIGWGVYDRLVQLNWSNVVIPVQVGEPALDTDKYFNKRAELYDKYRLWIKSGADIPDMQDLRDDLVGPQYGWTERGGKLVIESKKDMKRRGIPSPDILESAILTFAEDVSDGAMDFPRMSNEVGGGWMSK